MVLKKIKASLAPVNKNDDLCDSLLHAYVWLEWMSNYETLARFANENTQCTELEGRTRFEELVEMLNTAHKTFMENVITKI